MSAPAPYQASGASAAWGLDAHIFEAHGLVWSFGPYIPRTQPWGYFGGVCVSVFLGDDELDLIGRVLGELAAKARDRGPTVSHVVGLELKLDPWAVVGGHPGLLVEASGTAADLRPLV